MRIRKATAILIQGQVTGTDAGQYIKSNSKKEQIMSDQTCIQANLNKKWLRMRLSWRNSNERVRQFAI